MNSLAVLRCAFNTTVPWVGLQCLIVVIPDELTCSFEVRIYHNGAVGWFAVCNCGNS